MKSNIPTGITQGMISLLSEKRYDSRLTAGALACRGYCDYYQGSEGDGGCGGLSAVRKGVATGRIGLTEISYLLEVAPGAARRSGCLTNELCSNCSYRPDGCDFMSASPPSEATPCGGYRLLQALLDCGALTPVMVRGMTQNTESRTQNVE